MAHILFVVCRMRSKFVSFAQDRDRRLGIEAADWSISMELNFVSLRM